METLRGDYNIVAAIDFGTTNCGVLYSFKKEYENNIMQMWNNAGDSASSYVKETSAILLNDKGKFVAFGDDAETKYGIKAMDENYRDKYFLFRYFKMHLHMQGKELARYSEISDVNGKKFRAKKIFSLSIQFLKKQLIDKINQGPNLNVKEKEIRWVITIPAIWSEKATQLMREAGNDAGIPDDQLLLVYEPEAAAVLCKMETMERRDSDELKTFDPGSKFMVVDLGGGTVDICVEEVNERGQLKALDVPAGGPSGGVNVDDAFLKIFVEIVGPDIFRKFKEEHPLDLYKLLKEFEDIKRKVKSEEDDDHIIQIPNSILKLIRMKLTTFQDLVSKSKHSSACECKQDYLSLKSRLIKSFYVDTVEEIAQYIEHAFKNMRERNVEVGTMILVGGFSAPFFVRELLKYKFSHRVTRITIPNGAPMAILKGAVIFGHNPRAIAERICPYTYGLKTRVLYDPKRHKGGSPNTDKEGNKKITVFQKHVEKGDVVVVGEPLKNFKFVTIDEAKRDVFWEVWRSEEKDPIFCDPKICTEIGKLEIKLEGKLDRKRKDLSVQMICRGTELEAVARDESTKSMI